MPIMTNSNNYKVTASIGLINLNKAELTHTSIDDILHRADIACYQAKRSGRDQISVDA